MHLAQRGDGRAVRFAALVLSLASCNVALVDGRDAGDAGDGGGDAGVNGCTPAEFAAGDHTAAADLRLITFPTTPAPAAYQPRCMRVKVGQKVTWLGDLASHPLEPHSDVVGAASSNPISPTSTGTSAAFTFSTVGTFGFACAHHPTLMLGAINVVR